MPVPAHAMLLRSGGGVFSPLSIAWQSVFWAEDPGWSNPGDGNAVSSWNNAGSDGTDAVQATGGNQPIYRATESTLNNKPAIEFVTTDTLVADVADVAMPWTLVYVATRDSASAMMAMGYGSGTGYGSGFNGTNWRYGFNSGNQRTVGTDSTALVVAYVDTTSGGTIEVNGVGPGTLAGAPNADLLVITIGDRNATTQPFDGRIAFLGLISGSLAAGDLTDLETWATAHYGITIA